MALQGKTWVGSLFLIEWDSVGVPELFVVVAGLLAAQQFREELDATRPVEGIQEDQVGHGFRVEVKEPFPHLIGLEEDGSVGGASAEEPERGFVQ